MSNERLNVSNVSVKYLTGDIKNIGLREYILKKIRGQFVVHEFWANKSITFAINEGDMLGIIGTNGAGKTTLLKAISGILSPSEGTIIRKGNIAALLELSSGFDGDLTVRENTYLRGAMLGYSRKFMDEKYDEIIDFAELKDFEDTPFRQLSSGMKSRIAFSIACLVNPDILILDEVLSVGDGAFKKKSEEKMMNIIKSGATTILVSHSTPQIQRLCNKVLWLHKGKQIAFSEDVDTICNAYDYFLSTRILPENEEELLEMAQQQKLVLKAEKKKKQNQTLKEAKKIQKKRELRAKKKKAAAKMKAELEENAQPTETAL